VPGAVRWHGRAPLWTWPATTRWQSVRGISFVLLRWQRLSHQRSECHQGGPRGCTVFAATANALKVVVADDGTGRGVLGVIDGDKPKGTETEKDAADRKALLRRFGYKF